MTDSNLWFPFFVGDYKAATMGLSHEERGIFVDLLCFYCHRQLPLPNDDTQLAKLTGLTLRRWKTAREAIAPLFTIKQGIWTLPQLDKRIARGLEIREKRRLSGRIGGQKSWAKRQANAQAIAEANAELSTSTSTGKDKEPICRGTTRAGLTKFAKKKSTGGKS